VLGREPRLTLRLLLIALPLSLLMAWLVGVILLHGVNLWLLAVLAAIVMPIDLAPAAFVRDRRIPERPRQVLTAESGLTDGIVAPVFLFCLAAATAAGNEALADAAIDAGPARVLPRALRAGWTQPSALRLDVLALPLLAYAGAVVLGGNPGAVVPGGNGFIAAFVAGVFFEPEARRLPADALHPGRGGLRLGRCGSARTGARVAHRQCYVRCTAGCAPRTSNAPIRSQSSGCRWPNARRARLVEPTHRGWDRPRPPPWHCRRPVPVR